MLGNFPCLIGAPNYYVCKDIIHQ